MKNNNDYISTRLNIRNEINIIKSRGNSTNINNMESSIKNTSPSKASKNRSRSFDFSKTGKSNFYYNITTKNSSKKTRYFSVDLRREMDDPANDGVRDEIERVIHFNKQIEQIKSDFILINK